MSSNPARPTPPAVPTDPQALPVARPWRPELQPAAGAPEPRAWRPDLPAAAGAPKPPAPRADNATEANLLGSTDEPAMDEQEMAMVAGGPTRIRASLNRGNLALFGLFVVGIAVVAFMSLRKGPQSVSAADRQAAKTVDSAIDKFLNAQPTPAPNKADPAAAKASADKLISDTRHLVEMFFNFTAKKQVPLENLRTNPFRFDDSEKRPESKSLAAQKADDAARKARADKAKQAVSKLRLQTILTGPAGRQAMINASVLKVGDSIEGFKVEDIQARSVKLSCEGAEFTLEMGH